MNLWEDTVMGFDGFIALNCKHVVENIIEV